MQSSKATSAGKQAGRIQFSEKFFFWLDEPANWDAPVRWLRLSGWCVAKTGQPLTAIRAIVKGRIFSGAFDRERPEVAAYLGVADAPRWCGFTLDVRVPLGRARLQIQVAGENLQWQKAWARDVRGPLWISAEERANSWSRFKYWIHPSPETLREKKERYLRLEGWCFAVNGPELTELRARVGGRSFRGHYGILRPDVAVAYERAPGTLRSGFALDAIVPAGKRTLILEARSGSNPWQEFFVGPVKGPLQWHARDDVSSPIGNYPAWIRLYDRVTRTDRRLITRRISAFGKTPLISILLPVYNSDVRFLRRAIESVRAQFYPNWELCVVDDASSDARVWQLLKKFARRDVRIKIQRREKRGHISAASNDALARATGEFTALLDHDDELASTALYFVAHELNCDPDLQLLYSDEDKLDADGRRVDPHFKPDWNPDLLTSQNYISHLEVYRTELLREIGGFRVGFEGAQDFDLTWRFIEKIEPQQIKHIPHVLYHWRTAPTSMAAHTAAKPYAQEAARKSVQEHIERTKISGSVKPDGAYLQVQYAIPAEVPRVSIIIPTRDRSDFLRRCIESILERTSYGDFEIVVLDNESQEPEALDYVAAIAKNPRITVIRQPGPFNYSKLNNYGVAHSSGVFVLLMNNDLEVINPEWLTEMCRHGMRANVGIVGARLWYPNDTIQHAGVILGASGIGSHAHTGLHREEHGYFSRPHLTQNFSAVTGACLLVRRDLYLEMNGLDEINLAVAFNDVDFCLRVRAAGFDVVWTPAADLYHYESSSRGFEDTRGKRERFLTEAGYMRAKWGALLEADPAYNPNLSLSDQLFTLAFPPRVQKPWRC